ncbi:hypothetical protein [Acinetobacter towneri]|uniref:hypothetical protein n=1 Tax=Acinetobacter towneri TaxID=202956 RepID=UPI0039897500
MAFHPQLGFGKSDFQSPEGSMLIDPDRTIYPKGYYPHQHPHGDGDFCPPGQAKKGRC